VISAPAQLKHEAIHADFFRFGGLAIIGVLKPSNGRVYVQKLYGGIFLRGKYTGVPGASRKLPGRVHLAKIRSSEEKE
jgi:hypothetical protein